MNTSTFENPSESRVSPDEQREGPVARAIEERTARIPSDLFLWAAGASILGSLAIQAFSMTKMRAVRRFTGLPIMGSPLANFVGEWAPTILLLGLYNKIVKVAGSDRSYR